jgi:hypothetical protein
MSQSERPYLTFFCELELDPLVDLLDSPAVMDGLATLGATLSLGILDLSAERAQVVRRLNERGIPVIAWLLLPRDQGYWFNADNAPQAAARYQDFKDWTQFHGLQWAAVGVDIEPDIRQIEELLALSREEMLWQGLKWALPRALDGQTLRQARSDYGALVAQIRADGYWVDSYHIPLIVDERRAASELLQRVTGLVDVPADREVLMLYSSELRPRGPGILWSYGADADSVGVGNTGGGVELGPVGETPLDWEEFARDLRLAWRRCDDIHVFCLEGCVRQGFLERLQGFDWDGPVEEPLEQARRVDTVRRAVQAGLWASAHPGLVMGVLVGVLWLWGRRKR